jgi:hypothetical protein
MHSGVGGSEGDRRDAARELIAQKLRELPNEARPPFDWSELRRRMQAKSVQGQTRRRVITRSADSWARGALPAIVGAVMIAAAGLVMDRIERGGGEFAGVRPNVERAQPAQASVRLPGMPGLEAEALLARADSAERWLAERPDDAAIVQVSTHLAIANLEDRIASMDDLLNLERLRHAYPSRLRALQLQRAQLVDSLAQVRYAEMLVEETP